MSNVGQTLKSLQALRDDYYSDGAKALARGDRLAMTVADAQAAAVSEAIRITIEGIN